MFCCWLKFQMSGLNIKIRTNCELSKGNNTTVHKSIFLASEFFLIQIQKLISPVSRWVQCFSLFHFFSSTIPISNNVTLIWIAVSSVWIGIFWICFQLAIDYSLYCCWWSFEKIFSNNENKINPKLNICWNAIEEKWQIAFIWFTWTYGRVIYILYYGKLFIIRSSRAWDGRNFQCL